MADIYARQRTLEEIALMTGTLSGVVAMAYGAFNAYLLQDQQYQPDALYLHAIGIASYLGNAAAITMHRVAQHRNMRRALPGAIGIGILGALALTAGEAFLGGVGYVCIDGMTTAPTSAIPRR